MKELEGRAEDKTTLYCYLWMPTYVHENFDEVRLRRSDVSFGDRNLVNVSDSPKYPCYAWVGFANNNISESESKQGWHDIVIRIKGGDKERKDDLSRINLEYESHSSNGIFCYKCTYDKSDFYADYIVSGDSTCLTITLYHHIKALYHDHTFHPPVDNRHCDGLMKAFISPHPIIYRTSHSRVVQHYLGEYEHRFREAFDKAVIYYNTEYRNSDAEKVMNNCKDMGLILGESVFALALCRSKYCNCDDKQAISEGGGDSERTRKMVLNIENLIRGVEVLKNDYLLNYTKKSDNKAWRLAWFAMGVSIVGVFQQDLRELFKSAWDALVVLIEQAPPIP